MVAFRLLALIGLLLGFVALAAPLQWLARRHSWQLARQVPVLFSRSLCWALQIRTFVAGSQSPLRPQLVVANHVSWVDILVLGCRDPQSFLAKREVGNWPVFGTLARLQGTVFVDRQRLRCIPTVNMQMARAMQAGNPMVLFAEATTSDGTRVKRFHSSHFAAARDLLAMDAAASAVVVQPVGIAYVRRNGLPLGRHGRSEVAWYGDMTLLPHLWRLLSGGPVDCHLVFVPVLAFRRGDDRKLISRQAEIAVRDAVSTLLSGQPSPDSPVAGPNQSVVSILFETKTA